MEQTDNQLLQQKIQVLERQLGDLKKSHTAEVSRLRDHYEKKLREHDRHILQAIAGEQQRMKAAWTWRIGSVMVAPAVAAFALVRLITGKAGQPAGQRTEGTAEDRQIAVIRLQEGETVDGPVVIEEDKANICAVFDTFTFNCFRHEFNCFRPSPEQWPVLLEKYPMQALFVESAWRGNENTWTNQVGRFSKTSEKNLDALLAWCREHAIPTIFWNKEDPVHYNYFLRDAVKFDYIFTTDEGVVEQYRQDSGNNKVFSLPFAAQPAIHNPVRDYPRDGSVCFAGTYYNLRYVERKSDMDILLRPSLDFGLDIYDRNFGATGEAVEQYRFPDIYQPAIRGRLEYDDMVKAYKRYKVFLNVNSVRNSSTMFARRVFELLACGTPVISTYSKGITEVLGEGTVLISDSEEDTRRHLEYLLKDEHAWWKQSLKGMRVVMHSHTYTNRTRDIFSHTGLRFQAGAPVKIRVIAPIASTEDAEYILEIFRKQTYRHVSLTLCQERAGAHDKRAVSGIREMAGAAGAEWIDAPPAAIASKLSPEALGLYHAIFHKDDYYGAHYLEDYALAISATGATMLGKRSTVVLDRPGSIGYSVKGFDFMLTGEVNPGSLVIRGREFKNAAHDWTAEGRPGKTRGNDILSIDPYNYLKNGRRAYQKDKEGITRDISI